MSHSPTVLDILNAHSADLRARFGLTKLGVFGSCARGDHRESSDADILVEFAEVDFDRYMDLKFPFDESKSLTLKTCSGALSIS